MDYARRHLRFGWWSLLLFSTLGLTLEALHGFKIGTYLDVSNETRRLMWTLAHAHGALLGIVHILFALTLRSFPDQGARRSHWISSCLIGASIVLPGGFFLGGVSFYAGDPGLGVLLVPIGAVLLLIAIYYLAIAAGAAGRTEQTAQSRPPRGGKQS